MKKTVLLVVSLFIIATLLFMLLLTKSMLDSKRAQTEAQQTATGEQEAALSNPASLNCKEKGGDIEVVTKKDGGQFSTCVFDGYACEEWAFLREECNFKEDSKMIEQELIGKGLNLSGMKVVIKKHLGKYMGGAVVPMSEPAGGGYVYAVKTNEGVKVLADGNGIIKCESFKDYPDFPSYLVSGCVDESGNLVSR